MIVIDVAKFLSLNPDFGENLKFKDKLSLRTQVRRHSCCTTGHRTIVSASESLEIKGQVVREEGIDGQKGVQTLLRSCKKVMGTLYS